MAGLTNLAEDLGGGKQRTWEMAAFTIRWVGEQMVAYQTVEYYSAAKGNEVLTHTTTQINLENTMLSERSQTQGTTYGTIPFI